MRFQHLTVLGLVACASCSMGPVTEKDPYETRAAAIPADIRDQCKADRKAMSFKGTAETSESTPIEPSEIGKRLSDQHGGTVLTSTVTLADKAGNRAIRTFACSYSLANGSIVYLSGYFLPS